MNANYFLHMWRRNWIKVAAVTGGCFLWGFLAPVIYKSVLSTVQQSLPPNLANFGSGTLNTFPGVITLMFEHPFLIALVSTIALAITIPALAGQRQRGTLEMLLARPIKRPTLVTTIALAVASMLLLVLLAMVVGILAGSSVEGLRDEVPVRELLVVWLWSALLYGAFASFGLAASATSNRNGPAVSWTLGFLIANYFFEILGGFWEQAKAWQPYSLFHHFQAADILAGRLSGLDLMVLGLAIVIPITYALYVFPRRDLPAPD
jgi:ABC-type transport system involved in multi-copper enzyme maturation permease subunit